MRVLRKPEIVASALLFLAALVLILGRSDEGMRESPMEVARASTARHPAKSGPRLDGKSERDHMPSLSRWPSAKVVSINRDWGFVMLKPDTLSVAKGDVAFLEGVPHGEAWLQVASADEQHLIADLKGSHPASFHVGDRVVFSNRPVALSAKASVNPSEIRWTDPDTAGWAD